jgi:hypothetical protein
MDVSTYLGVVDFAFLVQRIVQVSNMPTILSGLEAVKNLLNLKQLAHVRAPVWSSQIYSPNQGRVPRLPNKRVQTSKVSRILGIENLEFSGQEDPVVLLCTLRNYAF